MSRRSSVILALGTVCVGMPLVAKAAEQASNSDWKVTLRAANEPSSKDKTWDRGATFAYQSVNGASTVQADLVLKLSKKISTPLTSKPAPAGKREYELGSKEVSIEPAAYLHRSTSSAKPQNDRGLSLGMSLYLVPASAVSGAPMTYDFGITGSVGKSLKQGSGAFVGQFFDANSRRISAHAMVYYRPGKVVDSPETAGALSQYFVGTAKLYGDRVSGAQNATANGTVAGTSLALQYSVAPFGTEPNGNKYGVAPSFSLVAQRQWDSSASGGRVRGTRSLYTLAASFPFTPSSTGVAPSIDISRSIGADILQGREDKAETRVSLGFKF